MLKAIANAPVRGNIPIKTNVGGELNVGAKINRPKLIAADVRRTGAGFERQRYTFPGNFEARPNRTDKCIFAATAKPARRGAEARLQPPILGQVPPPKIVVEEGFRLQEMLATAFGGKADASARGLKLKFFKFRGRDQDGG